MGLAKYLVEKNTDISLATEHDPALCSLPLLCERVTLRSSMKREHLCLKCSSIIRPLWGGRHLSKQRASIMHIRMNCCHTVRWLELDGEKRAGLREERVRESGSVECVSL